MNMSLSSWGISMVDGYVMGQKSMHLVGAFKESMTRHSQKKRKDGKPENKRYTAKNASKWPY